MNPIRSRRMRLPGRGALGLMSSAGIPLRDESAVYTVTPTVHKSATNRTRMKRGTLVANDTSVKPYIIL